jgi:hypothetical protein
MAAGPAMGTRDVLGEPERSGVRNVLASMRTQVAADDVVYVYYKSQSAVELYGGPVAQAVKGITWINGSLDVREGTRVADDLRKLSGHRRVWFLFSEVHTFFVDEERLMLTAIERQAQRRAEISSGPARAYLYESASGRWTGD